MTDAPAEEPLDFERAAFDQQAAPALACQLCKQPLRATYYSVNGHGMCTTCLQQLRDRQRGSFWKALALGSVAGAAGAAIYYGIRTATGYDIGLVTIVVGIGVGMAVRMGAGNSQSRFYRVLAVALAYVAMCSTRIPALLKGVDGSPEAGQVLVAALLSLTIPFYLVMEAEVLSLLIFGFGLWEAFRLSAPRAFEVAGPFEAALPPPASVLSSDSAS